MLVEFQVKNYRSFRDHQALSMVAGRFTEHTEANTIPAAISGFDRFLRSSVIYGANAAGKTNLLRGLQLMQTLVLNSASSPPGTALPYDPFKFAKSSREEPCEFQVTFVDTGTRYEYGFAFDAERIREEWLLEDVPPPGRPQFLRALQSQGRH